MEDKLTLLGGKLKEFRKKAGLSQLDLELEIDASPGSISRIEAGKINPTKETLSKIAQVLNLKSAEIAALIGVNIFSPEELVKAINELSKSLDLDIVLQTAVDIMFNLYPNYNGGVILLIKDTDPDKVASRALSTMPHVEKVYKILPNGPISNHQLSFKKDGDNFIIRSIKEDKYFESKDLYNFARGAVHRLVSIAVEKILGFKIGISIPMKYQNKNIGAVLYTKRKDEPYTLEEIKILELLNTQIAIAIKNAERFKELSYKLENNRDISR